ncbi:MAG TPA: hypothetical protein VFJ82_17495 [Longimicrobium sp.]|nr:hypothetical protein [Longimicrobium sp.]
MRRAAPAFAAAAALILARATPTAAQSARATMTASATVVEPISLAAGTSTVSATRGTIDVTTPVSVRGRAAHVVQVVRASGAEPPVRGAVRGHGMRTQPNGATESDWEVRLRLARQAANGPSAVTYVVSTLN